MSLQVWLPFTDGTLKQQGLKNVEAVIGGNISLNDNGKLGKCATISASGGGITLPASSMTSFTECTVAFWIKINSWNTSYATFFQAGLNSIAWNNYIFGILRNNTGSNLCFTLTNSNGTSSSATYTTSNLNTAQWYHLAFTYKAGTICIYIDGVLDKTYSTTYVPNFAGITNISIGRGNNNSSYQTNCNLNDFILYDHCLSSMEVKELSKGLVLHYPLNRGGWGQENLLSRYVVPGQAAPTSTAAGGRTTWLGDYKITIPATENADTYFRLFTTKQLTANATYTISCKVSGLKEGSYYRFPLYDQNNTGMGVLQLDHNGLCSLTFTMTYGTQTAATGASGETVYICFMDDSARSIASGQGAITVSDFKLEEGSIATPWCPNSSDTLATTMGLNSATEYDCSGFCNNGEYYAYDANGSISYTSDTPKYNVSTHIASANPTQNAASGTRYLYGHCELTNPTQMSVAFWLKPITGGYGGTTSNGQGYFCTTNYEYGNISVGSDYQASAMNHRDGAVNMNDSASTTQCNVTFYPTIGEWHHYVYTYDGQVGRGYKDGVQTATAQFSAAKTLDSFIGVVIGFSKAGGVWRRNDACYSDFRVYATALSASDVKSLYQNSAYIDSSGNVYGAVHSEV